jgi:hypothetical protein
MATNAQLYQLALRLGLVSTPTEFWTKVRSSGLSPSAWISLASSHTMQAFTFPCPETEASDIVNGRFDFDTRSRY